MKKYLLTLKVYTKIKFYSSSSTEEEMIRQSSGFMEIRSKRCLVKKQRWYWAIKIYIYIVKNCLPLYLSSLIFIISTSCSASRPYTITWRWHRIFHGEKNYVLRDEVVNSGCIWDSATTSCDHWKLFYTSHTFFTAGSALNPDPE